MFDVIMKFFAKNENAKNEKKSGQIAKDRLQLVLVHDRASVSPEIMEKIRQEIIAVISKYMDVNKSDMKIQLANDEDSVALVANIPVESFHHGKK